MEAPGGELATGRRPRLHPLAAVCAFSHAGVASVFAGALLVSTPVCRPGTASRMLS